MLKIDNLRVRLNGESTTGDLLGWSEFCLIDDNHKFYINNVRVKAKVVEGVYTVRLEFPSKTIIAKDGTDKKVFFIKPVNSAAYNLVCGAVIKYLKELANAGKNL